MDVTNAIRVARMTDVGQLRGRNEDAIASDLSTGVIMVADGMGGYKGGAVASEIAILVVISEVAELMHIHKSSKKANLALPIPEMLSKAVAKANNTIFNASYENAEYEGMGTTFVAGVFNDNKVIVGHIGDSRMYRLRNEALEQLTEDHSLLQEQINAGIITKEQAKNSNEGHLVTRALGTDAEVELEMDVHETTVGDIYLLCSDGLTDLVDDEYIRKILLDNGDDIDLAASGLIKLANKHGGNDNISVVIALVRDTFAMKSSWMQKILG
ncbi:MAG: Stp1/IreP family PP2C-type Ser/Thr phosphatase [Methylophilaceae bacterium]